MLPIARDLAELGFQLVATRGTAAYLRAHGLDVDVVYKVNEGRPNVADEIVNRKIALVINTPLGRESFFDDRAVRRAAMMHEVPCITTLTGAAAAVSAIRALRAARRSTSARCRTTTPASAVRRRLAERSQSCSFCDARCEGADSPRMRTKLLVSAMTSRGVATLPAPSRVSTSFASNSA